MYENQNNNNNMNNAQFENQQMGNGFYSASGVEPVTAKSKGKKGAVVGGVAAVAIAGGCVSAYAFSDTVKNQVKLRTMKPENYYAWVCENNSNSITKEISDNYAKSIKRYKDGTGVNVNVNYEMPDDVKSQLKDLLGNDEQLNPIIDNIRNISINADAKTNPNGISYNVGAFLNDDKLATAEVAMDSESMDCFMRCPELTEKWINADLSSLTEENASDDETAKMLDFYKDYMKDPESILSAAQLEDELNKYIGIWTNATKDVTVEKKASVQVADIEVDYTVAEVKLDQATAQTIAKDYIEALKNDDVIKGIVVDRMGIPAEDYTSDLDSAISEIESSVSTDDVVTLKTYIDPTGTIRGISMSDDTNGEVKAIIGKDGDVVKGEFSVTDEFTATLSATEASDKSITGNMQIEAEGEKVTVDFTDFKVVDEEKGYCSGKFTINIPDVDPIVFDLTSDGSSVSMNYDLVFGGQDFGKLGLTYSVTPGASADIPAKDGAFVVSADNADEIELSDYVAQEDMEAFLKDIFTKVGFKAEDADAASKALASNAYGDFGYDDYDFDDDIEFEEDFDEEDADIDLDDFDSEEYDFDEEDFNIEIPEVPEVPSININT